MADDQMIMDADIERGRRLNNLKRHVDIGGRGRRIARGVVVDEDDRGRAKLKRALDYFTRINGGVIDRAGLLHLIGDQVILVVEEEEAELLDLLLAHRALAIFKQRLPRADDVFLLDLGAEQLLAKRLGDLQG